MSLKKKNALQAQDLEDPGWIFILKLIPQQRNFSLQQIVIIILKKKHIWSKYRDQGVMWYPAPADLTVMQALLLRPERLEKPENQKVCCEVVSSRNVRKVIVIKSQNNELNRTWTRTTPINILIWKGEPYRISTLDKELQATKNCFSPGKKPMNWLSNIK